MDQLDLTKSLLNLSSPCLGCISPKCESFCRSGIPYKTINMLIKEGKIKEASELLYDFNPFPELTLALCDCSSGAKGNCIKGKINEPIDTKEIERLLSSCPFPYINPIKNNKKVAIIGSGPAGCSLAYQLIKKGYEVTIFEKNKQIGGAIFNYIPRFRFDMSILDRVKSKLDKLGVKFVFFYYCDKDKLDQLKKEYDYVYLCIGNNLSRQIPYSSSRIIYGLDLLNKTINNSISFDKEDSFVVYGGGNVAFDCANLLLKQGHKVTLLYRRDFASMPANKEEIDLAISNGISFVFTSVIDDIEEDKDNLIIKTIKTKLGEVKNGRASFENTTIKGETLIGSYLITCIGQKSDYDLYKIANPCRQIEENVFLCGDYFHGSKTIGEAIKDAKIASSLID